MRSLNKAGFTIVETMLFLGISGLLIMGILIGTGASLNVQRYRDSVTSLQSFFQQQYSEVANVSNDNLTNKCTSGGPDSPRGQSNCVILGRFITYTNTSLPALPNSTLTITQVLGNIPPGTPVISNDVDALVAYNIYPSTITSETYDIEWGASISSSFSILMLRSPSSGVIRTFISNSVIPIPNMTTILSVVPPAIVPLSLNTPAKLCVIPNGLNITNLMSVVIGANSTGANGVTFGDDSSC